MFPRAHGAHKILLLSYAMFIQLLQSLVTCAGQSWASLLKMGDNYWFRLRLRACQEYYVKRAELDVLEGFNSNDLIVMPSSGAMLSFTEIIL